MSANAATAGERLRDRARLRHCGACERREQHLTDQLERFRMKSRWSSVRARRRVENPDELVLADGGVGVSLIEIPDEVAPGGIVETRVTVFNGLLFASPSDPNHCTLGLFGGAGHQTVIEVNPSWTGPSSRENCIPVKTAGVGEVVESFRMQAPNTAGTYSIEYVLELPGSEESTSHTEYFTVASGAPVEPDPGGGDPGDGNGGNGGNGGDGGGPLLPCLLDPNRSCSTGEALTQGALGFALVLLLFQAGVR